MKDNILDDRKREKLPLDPRETGRAPGKAL
jgi:hypothetical protein